MTETQKSSRAYSLDALRGYAIITMVLSGTIASGILPTWMYHAQVPPPAGIFDPSIFGITWVDLVFPFFLFAMGAAFPLSIGRKLEQGVSRWKVMLTTIERGIKLAFFAIFIQHLYPWSISAPQDTTAWLLSIFGFVMLFPMFLRIPGNIPNDIRRIIEIAAFIAGIVLLLCIDYREGKSFDLYYSNIIILVLANMALFGSIIYLFTKKNRLARIAVLPFVMAILLGGATVGSWQADVLNYSPFSWFYQFRFLKYLFIVIPGSIAGEYLVEWMQERKNCIDTVATASEKRNTAMLLFLCLGLIVLNLWGLFTRHLVINLFATAGILALIGLVIKNDSADMRFWRRLFVAGTYLLMLGLFFEAFEGGIRKDHSTFSYYFVTSGLACFALISFSIMCDVYRWKKLTLPLEMAGKNPMIAYVATSMLVMPLLHLVGLADYLQLLETNAWLGFLRGVILTAFATMIAMFFTKIKWFWRT